MVGELPKTLVKGYEDCTPDEYASDFINTTAIRQLYKCGFEGVGGDDPGDTIRLCFDLVTTLTQDIVLMPPQSIESIQTDIRPQTDVENKGTTTPESVVPPRRDAD